MTPALAPRPCPTYACTGCGRDMVVLAGDAPADSVCHLCRMLSGWRARPEVVALCDSEAARLAAFFESEVGHA